MRTEFVYTRPIITLDESIRVVGITTDQRTEIHRFLVDPESLTDTKMNQFVHQFTVMYRMDLHRLHDRIQVAGMTLEQVGRIYTIPTVDLESGNFARRDKNANSITIKQATVYGFLDANEHVTSSEKRVHFSPSFRLVHTFSEVFAQTSLSLCVPLSVREKDPNLLDQWIVRISKRDHLDIDHCSKDTKRVFARYLHESQPKMHIPFFSEAS